MNVDEKIFDFIFIEAMGDATIEGAYGEGKSELKDVSKLSQSKKSLCTFVEKVREGGFSNQEDYDDEFLELAKTVCSEIADITGDNEFTFGNAQKLINMTLKYFFITTYGRGKEERDKFQFCHCPMDVTMINTVWGHRDELGDLMKEVKSDYFHKSWGNEDFENGCYPERYKIFQCAVRFLCDNDKEDLFPIEYDFWKWNESKSK